ncbi:MAG: glycosyl hydrolase [Spirosomataceae bacterium]
MKKTILFFFLLNSYTSFAQNTAKPWAYWWWMGSAVSKEGIAQNLQSYAKAGFGGMHIIPIYGVKGEEKNFIPYLTPQWLEMLDFTVQEANKLGLSIDMTVGTGWPFGGSHVTETDAAKVLKLTQKDGKYEIGIEPTKQKVKRAAPGGEGWVVDHFNKSALDNYFKPFQEAFKQKNYGIRAFYNDSYEVYGANWTTNFLDKFKQLRGYDLSLHLDVLDKKTTESEREKRIWSDYHETISDLLFNEFTKTYVGFAHQFGKQARNESHGSPANILDLYALSDMPESEFFGSKPYNIPLYRQDPDYEESRFGKPDALVLKLASSAAHVSGKRLVTSETATWLANHFKVSLSQVKPIIDESFIGGINHIFYHGVPYSPPSEGFPGWLFYASTNFNQNSHFYKELPLLNKYIENSQNLLQNTKPDNDVLVYFPIFDLWHTAGRSTKTHPVDVHNIAKNGIFTDEFRGLLSNLTSNGFAFDFVSDKQILASNPENGNIKTQANTKYQAIVIPEIDYLPLPTLQKLVSMQKAGVKIVFTKKLPRFVNGFNNYEKRQAEFEKLIKLFAKNVSSDIPQILKNKGVRNEMMASVGLTFLRKKTEKGQLYFIANQDTKFKNGKITLSADASVMRMYNPMNGKEYPLNFEKKAGKIEIDLHLESGESIFIETNRAIANARNVKLASPKKYTGGEIEINGNWQVDFVQGEPFIPKSFSINKLTSWTTNPDTTAQYFSGIGKYKTSFQVADNQVGKSAVLYLGDVRESAKVWLNGIEIGTTWSLPFKVEIPRNILKKENILEIEVTNLSANRMRYVDAKMPNWKKFYDINMVDINYKPFDASRWKPVESGLLGPVKLVLE